jgi:hypothetical protein
LRAMTQIRSRPRMKPSEYVTDGNQRVGNLGSDFSPQLQARKLPDEREE